MRINVLMLAAMGLATAALAQEPPYVDDRSTPEAVITSFYNAIDRKEYARAWSYYQDGEGVPAFDAFVAGYADTASVAVSFGPVAQEGAAGSTYYTLPVSIDATAVSGEHHAFAGCYTLRLANPQVQAAPPFRPLHIVEGHFRKAAGAGPSFAPAACPPG